MSLLTRPISFEPGATNAKKAWQAKPESKSVLQWHPVLAAASTSDDLGYTTGPWSFKDDPAAQEATDRRSCRIELYRDCARVVFFATQVFLYSA